MKLSTETTTGTLHKDTAGKWYARTGLIAKAYLDETIQHRPDPNLEGVEVNVTLKGAGPTWVVTEYSFI